MKFKIFKSIVISILILLITILLLKRFVFKTIYIDYINENVDDEIDPYIILSIIKTESNFNPSATSNKNAKGLMQLLDATYEDVEHLVNINDIDLYDPKTNITIGTNYFNLLYKRYDKNYYLAICAYNAGIGNVDNWLNDGILSKDINTCFVTTPYKETNEYLHKVIRNYYIYKILYFF